MTPVRISVVTLSFNQAPFLEAALTSLHDQAYPGLEHIVIDPGSSDGSRDILARWRPRLARVILEPDRGPADGLNKGFAAATGDVFGYINADDMALPGSLAAIARHFGAADAPDMILGRGLLIDREGRARRRLRSSRLNLRDAAFGAMTFVQQGHYFTRRAFERAGGFNPENRTSWDWELLIDMARTGATARNVPEQLGAFRLYGDTISGSGRMAARMAEDLARIRAKALGRGPRPGDRAEQHLRLLARRLRDPAATLEGLAARLRPSAAAS
ncbi:MAG: glycosyltransferase family 2 protein [Polymorphobacter sp.]|uniref:glycosyltransferase family 2 protein n=1 Tax=Polymorphobacter sp. TaxID=1909290 RepID=UPI003A86BC5C